MRRRDPGSGELEALDPLTGESLTTDDRVGAGPRRDARRARQRRLRRLRRVLVALAVSCAAAAGYFGVTVLQLRSVERTWRHAMAVDVARADGDRQVRELLADVGAGDDDAALEALGPIGNEAAARLTEAERALRSRRIVDSKVSALRDEMVAALRFRRFQMSPQRRQIGDTPLEKVEVELAAELDRWGLDAARVGKPALTSVAPALAALRRFTNAPTNTTLFAADVRELITIDVDRSRVDARTVPRPILRLVPVAGGVAVFDGVEVTVYPADRAAPSIVSAPADGVVPTGDDTGDLWLVGSRGATVQRLRPVAGGQPQSPIPLPRLRHVLGATNGLLVLLVDGTGGLELWSPTTQSSIATLSSLPSRFLAADYGRVMWQGPLPFVGEPTGSAFLHVIAAGTFERDLIGLPPTDAASAVFGPDGTIAVSAGPLAGRLGSILLVAPGTTALAGAQGPRASVGDNAIAWSNDGHTLFWLTPDGEVAVRRSGDRPRSQLLRTGLDGLERLAAMGR